MCGARLAALKAPLLFDLKKLLMEKNDFKRPLDKSICLHPHRTAIQDPLTGKITHVYLPCGMCSACAARERLRMLPNNLVHSANAL